MHDLPEQFEANRSRLRAVAYRILGSQSEAEDAVQEAWLRLSRVDPDGIDNLAGWLTTVTSRVCLDMLRSREARRETWVADPIVDVIDDIDPEHEALIGDAVGLAMLMVLDTLSPGERLSYILHDMFAVPFEDIARIVERSPDAVRQMASRGRRRLRDAGLPDADPERQREVVEAFVAASRRGDFEALLHLLAPDVVLRASWTSTGRIREVHGADAVVAQARSFRRGVEGARLALVNGAPGIVSGATVMGFRVRDGKIVQIDIVSGAA